MPTIPKKINVYCPVCKKHTEHKITKIEQRHSPPTKRAMAKGQIRHVKKTKGYTSKLAGKRAHVKKASRNVIYLECPQCKKKHCRTVGGRTKKKLEFKKE